MTDDANRPATPQKPWWMRWKPTQETIAIITIGLTLGTLMIHITGDIRADMRAIRAEVQADRQIFLSELSALRAEARADREANAAERRRFEEKMDKDLRRFEAKLDENRRRFEAKLDEDRKRFEKEIYRLTAGQTRLDAVVASWQQENEGQTGPPPKLN